MKLYLASYAKDTINEIIKNDGVDPQNKTAVFIPTAGDPYDNKDFVEADRASLMKLGLKVADLDIKTATIDEIKNSISRADLVLVAGGDTFYLLDWLKKSGADKILKEYISHDGLYIGSSAGSIICCPTIEGAARFDDPSLAPDLRDYTGLNIFPGVVIPHAHKEKYFERIRMASEELSKLGFRVYTLTDDEALYFDGGKTKILKV